MIVNFRQPKSSCGYDNYKNLKKSSEWWTEFYSEMDLEKIRNIYIYSDSERAKKIIDSKNHFEDINSLFSKKFFSEDKTCYGILVISRQGYFQKKAGEYTQKNVDELISKLK